MAVTCEQVAALVLRDGRAAVAANPEVEEHVAGCDTCLERVIAAAPAGNGVKDLGASAMPLPPPIPASAAERGTHWLPPNLPVLPDAGFTGRHPTSSIRLKPRHLVLAIVGSALAGAVLVAAVLILLLPFYRGLAPAAPAATAEDDALSPAEGDVDDSPGGARGPRSARRRAKGKREAPPTARAAEAPTGTLSREDVGKGIRAGVPSLSACIGQAVKRNELTKGQHTIVVNFRIMPNGSVQDAQLVGPADMVGKAIGTCITAKLRGWRFPPSAEGTPVSNLRLPLNIP